MTIEIGLIFGAIACIIGVVGFVGGQKTGAKGDGERWGKFEANQAHILSELQSIKNIVSQNAKEAKAEIAQIRAEFKESLEREHARIDDIEQRVRLLEQKVT